jgi:hypothetical protein
MSNLVAIWDQTMRFPRIPNKGLGWDKLLCRITKIIKKCEQIPEKLAQLGSTPQLFKL